MKTFYWLVKREFWEHRGGFFRAPIITACIMLVINLMILIAAEVMANHHGEGINFNGNNFDQMLSDAMNGHLEQVGTGLDIVMYSSTLLIGTVLGFVVFFYCLGALYDDRRDRSILFWKSLPVSNTSTVLSKVFSATVIAPAVCFVVGIICGIAMLFMYAIALSLHGINVWGLLKLAHPFSVALNMLGSIPLYLLWSLPAVGWLMMCSAWSRSKPFLWAVLLPIGAVLILGWFSAMGFKIFSGQTLLYLPFRILGSVFPGGWLIPGGNKVLITARIHDNPADPLNILNIQHAIFALTSPDIWIGAAVGAAMISAAIWLRRWRDDS
jgi:ABC-2 type transport system permease protein